MTEKKLPMEKVFTEDLESLERSLMKLTNNHCCGFGGCGDYFGHCDGCNHCAYQIIRDCDSVVFTAIICNLAIALKSNESLSFKCR